MGGKRSGRESQTQKGGKEGSSCGGEDAAGFMGVQGRELPTPVSMCSPCLDL